MYYSVDHVCLTIAGWNVMQAAFDWIISFTNFRVVLVFSSCAARYSVSGYLLIFPSLPFPTLPL